MSFSVALLAALATLQPLSSQGASERLGAMPEVAEQSAFRYLGADLAYRDLRLAAEEVWLTGGDSPRPLLRLRLTPDYRPHDRRLIEVRWDRHGSPADRQLIAHLTRYSEAELRRVFDATFPLDLLSAAFRRRGDPTDPNWLDDQSKLMPDPMTAARAMRVVRMIASEDSCTGLRPALETLEQQPLPAIDFIELGQDRQTESLIVSTHGTQYLIETWTHPDGETPVGIQLQTSQPSRLAKWADELEAALAECWVDDPAEIRP